MCCIDENLGSMRLVNAFPQCLTRQLWGCISVVLNPELKENPALWFNVMSLHKDIRDPCDIAGGEGSVIDTVILWVMQL